MDVNKPVKVFKNYLNGDYVRTDHLDRDEYRYLQELIDVNDTFYDENETTIDVDNTNFLTVFVIRVDGEAVAVFNTYSDAYSYKLGKTGCIITRSVIQ